MLTVWSDYKNWKTVYNDNRPQTLLSDLEKKTSFGQDTRMKKCVIYRKTLIDSCIKSILRSKSDTNKKKLKKMRPF